MADDFGKKRPPEKRRPRRYKLYDRLNLSVRTVNGVIIALIALIMLLVAAGMVVR